MASLFLKNLDTLKGVGKKYQELFLKLSIKTVGDLLYFFPKSYQDLSNPFDISNAPIDTPCCVKARICSEATESKTASGKILQKIKACDEFSILNLIFFNSFFISKIFKRNMEFLFFGKIKNIFGSLVMTSPQYFRTITKTYIRPIYNQTAGLTSKKIESLVQQSLKFLPESIGEPIPLEIRKSFNLTSLDFAIRNIHFPKDNDSILSSRKYFAFEQMLIFQLKLAKLSYKNKKNNFILQRRFTENLFNLLPFKPTNAQRRCIEECLSDMENKIISMRRLIQGDVGSGKTVVALALCYNAAKNRFQSVMMAPTEILAKQHFNFFKKVFENENINLGIMMSSMGVKARKETLDNLKNGKIDVLLSTHAVLSDSVVFKKLALVITDEQHRFGVSQREKLLNKGDNPHMVIMSATPIPRTLALVFYGDLNISYLDEFPDGRQKVSTFFIRSKKRKNAFDFIKNLIKNGRQGFIVCPLIEEGETGLTAANEYFKILKNGTFLGYNIALLHGKMKNTQKNDIMNKFLLGEIDILVSTTIVEVGVDVPNAVFMFIENSERFGLSTLHQLRGRVGRANVKSYCILMSDTQSETSIKRFEILKNTFDGFKLANYDLKIRGPGEFWGTKQHGFWGFETASFCDGLDIFKSTQMAAKQILKQDPELKDYKNRYLRFKVKTLEEIAV
ncbi:MAG: ATP-dependent DNA helicase RecG [Oscillospiraceae bacterium]|jgi:ATP-dependent DNA helicase RecG|nr:ATP-dependent DNA helicase RecG [Oscillospiraceae bacterium]